jgi:hypothetical protein
VRSSQAHDKAADTKENSCMRGQRFMYWFFKGGNTFMLHSQFKAQPLFLVVQKCPTHVYSISYTFFTAIHLSQNFYNNYVHEYKILSKTYRHGWQDIVQVWSKLKAYSPTAEISSSTYYYDGFIPFLKKLLYYLDLYFAPG